MLFSNPSRTTAVAVCTCGWQEWEMGMAVLPRKLCLYIKAARSLILCQPLFKWRRWNDSDGKLSCHSAYSILYLRGASCSACSLGAVFLFGWDLGLPFAAARWFGDALWFLWAFCCVFCFAFLMPCWGCDFELFAWGRMSNDDSDSECI